MWRSRAPSCLKHSFEETIVEKNQEKKATKHSIKDI
jgi:hypothetical protein